MTITYHAGRRIQGLDSDRTATQLPSGSVGGWVELGRTTLGSAGSSIDVTSLADKRYYMVLADIQSSGITNIRMRNNGDTGNNYASRYCANGGTDSTIGSFNNMVCHNQNVTVPQFMVSYGTNRSANEKLWMNHTVIQNTAGATTAPLREESVCKHAQTSNPIDEINIIEAETGSFDTNSECVVLGWDPADTHTSNFWEELASVELGSDTSTIDSGVFTAKKYLWVQFYAERSATADARLRVGNSTVDTGSNYAGRTSSNGGSDSTDTSTSAVQNIIDSGNDIPNFGNMFIINNASNEKLMILHKIAQNTAGAGNAPTRRESVWKWTNTSNQINRIELSLSTGNYRSGGILKVWGAD